MQSLLRTRPRTSKTSRSRSRSCVPARSRAAPSTPTSRAGSACAKTPPIEVPYEHPALEPVLRETLGTIIFQDQVMEVAKAFAGFTPGEADGLRRAMSRKRSQRRSPTTSASSGARSATRAPTSRRQSGCGDGRGVRRLRLPQGTRRRLRAARLPVHLAARPLRPEFLCALLNEQPMGFYAPDSLVHEAEGAASRCCAGRERLGGPVHGRQRGRLACRRAHRARLRQGRSPSAEVARAGRRARAAGAIAASATSRRAQAQAAGARAARLVGCLRRPADGARAPARALWRLGRGTPAGRRRRQGTQLALPLEPPAAPRAAARSAPGSG